MQQACMRIPFMLVLPYFSVYSVIYIVLDGLPSEILEQQMQWAVTAQLKG